MFWRNKHPVCVFECTSPDAIHPDQKGVSPARKRLPRCRRGADEIGDCKTTRFHNAVAEPAHAPGMLDPIRFREPEILVDIGTNILGVEMHGAKPRRFFAALS